MKDRVSDDELARIIKNLKALSSGRTFMESASFNGEEIREFIKVCEDLRDARTLMEETAWLRPKPKKRR